MSETIVDRSVAERYDRAFARGDIKSFPSLDLVRLERWYFGGQTGRLLEYGFGTGTNLIYLAQRGYQIDGLDASSVAVQVTGERVAAHPELAARVRVQHLPADATRLPAADDTYDYLVCTSVLSLLGTPEKVRSLLAEFRRVLKPGGKLITDVNGPRSEFAQTPRAGGADLYEFRGRARQEQPIPTWCPATGEAFAKEFGGFQIDDLGFTHYKYLETETQEFIILARKA